MTLSKSYLFLLVAIFAIAPSIASSQTVYRWLDNQGVETFGHTPPPGTSATIVSTGKSTYRPEPGSESNYQGPYVSKKSNKQKTVTPSTQVNNQYTDEQRKTLCSQAQSNLAIINRTPLIRETDAEGNKRILTVEEKQERKNSAELAIKENC